MRRRPRQADKMPELMISPMLDLIFLLLAFFYHQHDVHDGSEDNLYCPS